MPNSRQRRKLFCLWAIRMSKHSNISIFVPHVGCPNMCSFCNQRTISGHQSVPTALDVINTCTQALGEVKSVQNTEIAFFGGSFTAIDKDYMTELLSAAKQFVGKDKFCGIRISTRPDCINEQILESLKSYGVRAIELGAQSLDDEVLKANDRGHTEKDVLKASELIKKHGFELGLQIMTGLYKSNNEKDMQTLKKVISINPDTLRIYPTVILEGTKLGELYKSGEYKPVSFESMVELCADMLIELSQTDISVIRCGLHASDNVSTEQVGGFYHPAFKELCESVVYRKLIEKALPENITGRCEVSVDELCISKAVGHGKSNTEYFKNKGIELAVKGEKNLGRYQCRFRG